MSSFSLPPDPPELPDAKAEPDAQDEEEPNGGLQLGISPQVAAGQYANFFQIRFSPYELYLDFGRLIPDLGRVEVLSRIILPAPQGPLLLDMVRANVTAWEERFGDQQPMLRRPEELRTIGFRTAEDLRREGLDVPLPRRIRLPSDPSRPDGPLEQAARPG